MRFLRRDRAPLYFLHIPKTAGSSVTLWLRRQVGDDLACPVQLWDQLTRIERSQLQKYKLFYGHFGVDLAAFLGRDVQTVTMLRDPLSRTISHYRHVRRDPRHPLHHRVAQESFEEFVRNRQNWSMIENVQARYLVHAPIVFAHYAARLDASETKVNRLSLLAEDARFLLDSRYVRERSLETIKRDMTVVGTTEQLPDFLRRVAKKFSLAPPEPEAVPFENVAPPSDSDLHPSSDTQQIVRELTQLDQELYEECRCQEEVYAFSQTWLRKSGPCGAV